MQHFFAEKCTSPLPNNNFENSFSRSLLLHLPFYEPMPITYAEGIKRPCHLSVRELVTFMREGKIGKDLDNKPFTTLHTGPISP
jgi:hypothetical protein